MKNGKLVPFSFNGNNRFKVSNRENKHDIKTNVHKIIYKGATLKNIKFTNSNLTKCNFKSSNIIGIDFMNSNLRNSSFRNATIENCIFFAVNLKGVDFKNVSFRNTFFINCDLSQVDNYILNTSSLTIIKCYPELEISSALTETIELLMSKEKFKKHFVLTTKSSDGKKVNNWIIYLLLRNFTEAQLNKAFKRLFLNDTSDSNRYFFTYYSYLNFLSRYYKIML